MKDCGLKSYQDIQEPEYMEGILDDFEKRVYLDEYTVDFFKEVLDIQAETGVQLWFDWMPYKIMVYTVKDGSWHSSGVLETIIDETFDGEYTNSSMEKQFDEMYLKIRLWRDKKLEVKNG